LARPDGGGWVLNGAKRWIGLRRITKASGCQGPRPQRLEYGGHRQPHDVSQSVRHTD